MVGKRILSRHVVTGGIIIALLVFYRGEISLRAQELGYGGLGPINHSMAGATTALPMDGSGAIFWNPATIGDLEHGEIQLGFGRINAPWYGDESLAYTALAPVVGVLWILGEEIDPNDYDAEERGKNREEMRKKHEQMLGIGGDSGDLEPLPDSGEIQRYDDPIVRGLSFTLVYPVDPQKRMNFGLGVSESGSLKRKFLVDPDTGGSTHMVRYRVKGVEISPTVSYRIGQRFYTGISTILGFNEFPEASLPQLSGFERFSDRVHFGVGFQWGIYYKSRREINLGLSVKSPFLTPAQQVQWRNGQGTVLTRKTHCSPEQPMRCSLGIAYTGLDRFKFSADVRYYDFRHLDSLYSLANESYQKYAMSGAVGAQFSPDLLGGIFSFRVGYQYTSGKRSWNDYDTNTSLPIFAGHSIHYGFSLGTPSRKGWEMSFSFSHGFGGGSTKYFDGTETRSFRDNPNENSFWWAVRYKR